MSPSIYYDYLHFIAPVLKVLAINSCKKNLNDAKINDTMAVGFDASWGHRRNSNNCLGILMDLKTMLIIAFHIVHHGPQENECLTHTDKHAKCMEAISLFKIIENTQLDMIDHLIFIHDCDLTDEKIIKDHLPKAIVKFDVNHYVKKNKKIIDNFCNKFDELRDLSEKIQSFYSILMHNKEITNEDKQKQWSTVPQHFIQTEDLDELYNHKAIEELQKFVNSTKSTFEDIISEYNTNCIESFNNTRAVLAGKRIAYRLSWQIRAYISILKWNDPYWEKTIFEAFQLNVPQDLNTFQIERAKKKEIIWRKTKTIDFKKARALKRSKTNSKYKITAKDTCVHVDQNIIPTTLDAKNRPLTINDFSGIQKWIIMAIHVIGVEDKPNVSGNKITNYILKYHYHLQPNEINDTDNKNVKNYRKNIKNQLTRLKNRNVISQSRFSYKLEI